MAACFLLLARSARASAQAPDSFLTLRPDAQVGSIDFRFRQTQSFSTAALGHVLELKGRGSFYGVRRLLGKLPVIREPGTTSFDPVELQRDVVRLRRFYQRSGFPQVHVDYDVQGSESSPAVDVTFLIDEGPPVVLRAIDVVGLPDLPSETRRQLDTTIGIARGHRFGDAEARAVEQRMMRWLQDHGYPFAAVQSSRAVDSLRHLVDVRLQMEPGPRSRLGAIAVEGNASVNDDVVLRELPFRPGDWYSADNLARGRRRLQGVDLFTQVVVAVDSTPTADSALPVRVRVQEARPRLAVAEVGYISSGAGLTGRAQWAHPNFTGGARGLSASIEIQTGIGVIDADADQLLRGALTFTLPYVTTSRLSLAVGPSAEYRDGWQDRSAAAGVTATLVYRTALLSSIALQYKYNARHIYEYRFGDVAPGNFDLLQLLGHQIPGLSDSLGHDIDESSLTLTGTWNLMDNFANPRRGWLIRPKVKVTVPAAFNTSQFVRMDATVSRLQPLGDKLVLVGRLSAGRLFPFGKSVPAPGDDPAFSFLRMRDESMTAGGTNDVRGWGDRLLGVKLPDAEISIEDTDTQLVSSRYVPIGALARFSGTVELRLPAPGLPPTWETHLFVDAGRVWTPAGPFSQTPLLPQDTPIRFSTGAGISYQTALGAIRLSLGYKLNPSALDLRAPDQVLGALFAGLPVDSVEPDWLRRLHLHLSIGVAL